MTTVLKTIIRRAAVAATLAVGLAFSCSAGPGVVAKPSTATAQQRAGDPIYSFVSTPDLFNSDIGDTRQLDTWEQGDPNSTSPEWNDSIDLVYDTLAAEPGDDVLVAGDQVFGHWGVDTNNTGLFGPVDTLAQREQAIYNAGDFYYDRWEHRFTSRGMNPFPAIGDHEIGDNPWSETGGYGSGNDWKRDMMDEFKDVWANEFPKPGAISRPVGTNFKDTAYAFQLHPEVLLITVDTFHRSNGDVRTVLTDGQLNWVDQVLDETTSDTVFVQGHVPVLRPVRQDHSSGLLYEGNGDSPFWQTLADHDDANTNVVYFAGEVHDVFLALLY